MVENFWTKSNRKPIEVYKVPQDTSWIGPGLVGIFMGLVFLGLFL